MATIFLAVAALMVVLSAGMAFAASPIIGTNGDEQLKGTNRAEEIRSLAGEDEIIDGLGRRCTNNRLKGAFFVQPEFMHKNAAGT